MLYALGVLRNLSEYDRKSETDPERLLNPQKTVKVFTFEVVGSNPSADKKYIKTLSHIEFDYQVHIQVVEEVIIVHVMCSKRRQRI